MGNGKKYIVRWKLMDDVGPCPDQSEEFMTLEQATNRISELEEAAPIAHVKFIKKPSLEIEESFM